MTPLGDFDFYEVLEATAGPALVMFTTPACSACRAWRDLLDRFTGDPGQPLALFVVDAQHNMALTREYEVFHLPALFLFVDGRFHCALQCEAAPEALRVALAGALAAPAQEAP